MSIKEKVFNEVQKELDDLAASGVPEEYRYQALIAYELKRIRQSLNNLNDTAESQLSEMRLVQF